MKTQIKKIDYTLKEENGRQKPVMHILGRDKNNKHIHVTNEDEIKPYFYVLEEEFEQIKNHDKIQDWEKGYTSIYDDSLVKVYTYIPGDVPDVRSGLDHFEADILFPNRWLIDTGIDDGIEIPDNHATSEPTSIELSEIKTCDINTRSRILFCDIEVNDELGFPSEDEATEEIVSISIYDNYADEYHAYLYHEETPNVKHPKADVHVYDDEVDMLKDFCEYLTTNNIDILAGWNFKTFDTRYLINRLDNLYDISKNNLSPLGSAYDEGSYYGGKIRGIAVFDMLKAYKNLEYTDLESYRLEDVSQSVLGHGKVKDDTNVYQKWKNNPQKLIEYNVKDVQLTVELEEHEEIIRFFEEVKKFVGGRLEEVIDYSDAVDIYVLRKLYDNYVLPSKRTIDSGEINFEGAKVFDPPTGIKEYVAVLDLASLYPMSMKTLNAGPRTKDPDGDITAPNGTSFNTDSKSFVTEIIDELLEEREKKKDQRDQYDPSSNEYSVYDRQQTAVKVIMNALYGTFGWEKFRLYDKDVAAAVTSVGREVAQHTSDVVKDMGYEPIYGDTDSVMVEFGSGFNTCCAITEGFKMEKIVNETYDDFAKELLGVDKHWFDIEFEKLYRKYIQASKKKRYAGHIVWKDGKYVDSIDITGFEYRRSDYGKVPREIQRKVIEALVKGDDVKEVKDIINNEVDKIKNDEYGIDELGIPGSITKEFDDYDSKTHHVIGSEYANENLGAQIQKGDKPKKMFVERLMPDDDGNVNLPALPQDNDGNKYICWINSTIIPDNIVWDYKTYINKQIKNPTERILDAVDMTWDELVSGQKQQGLSQFGNGSNDGELFGDETTTKTEDDSSKDKQSTKKQQRGLADFV